jgi:hypothetical protein
MGMKYVVFLFGVLLSSLGLAAQVNCGAPHYDHEPVIDENHVLKITILSDCNVTDVKAKDLSFVAALFVPRADDRLKIISGPVPEQFDNLPGQRYEVSEISNGHNDQVTIVSKLHLASDLTTRLHYRAESTKIQATGDSKYLREMDRETVFSQDKENAAFTYSHTVAIAKPWYAPSGVFTNEVKKDVGADFVKNLDQLSDQIRSDF